MAPRRGSSSYSSSGSSCEGCTTYLDIYGSEWKSSKTNAMFALEIILTLILIACLVLAARFKWVRKAGGRDRLRGIGYVIATVSLIIYCLLSLISTGLIESETPVTYLFYIISILQSATFRIPELLILAIIIRTLGESPALNLSKALSVVNMLFMVVLTMKSLAAFFLFTVSRGFIISEGRYSRSPRGLNKSGVYIDLAFACVYMVATVIAVVVAGLLIAKERSKGTIIMAAVVAPALFLRSLMSLISQATSIFPYSIPYKDAYAIPWANSFIWILMTMAIFLGVALIGIWSPGVGNPMGDYNQKPTGYAPNPSAYQSNAPVYYNNGAPTAYNNGQPAYNNGAPTAYNNGQPAYNTGAPTAYNNGQPAYNTGTPPTAYQGIEPAGHQPSHIA